MGVKCDDTLIKLPISKLIELYYDTHDEPNQKVLWLGNAFPEGAESDIEVTVQMLSANYELSQKWPSSIYGGTVRPHNPLGQQSSPFVYPYEKRKRSFSPFLPSSFACGQTRKAVRDDRTPGRRELLPPDGLNAVTPRTSKKTAHARSRR